MTQLHHLLELVATGRITPAEAEAELTAAGYHYPIGEERLVVGDDRFRAIVYDVVTGDDGEYNRKRRGEIAGEMWGLGKGGT